MEILNDSLKANLEEECDISHRGNMFRGLVFFIPPSSPSNEDSFYINLASIQIRYGGGKVSQSLSVDVTHVVVENYDEVDETIKIVRRQKIEDGLKLFKLVTFSWLQSCMEDGKVTN